MVPLTMHCCTLPRGPYRFPMWYRLGPILNTTNAGPHLTVDKRVVVALNGVLWKRAGKNRRETCGRDTEFGAEGHRAICGYGSPAAIDINQGVVRIIPAVVPGDE